MVFDEIFEYCVVCSVIVSSVIRRVHNCVFHGVKNLRRCGSEEVVRITNNVSNRRHYLTLSCLSFRLLSMMSTSTLQMSNEDPITCRLMRVRSLLMSSSIYLADDFTKIVDRAEWKRIGSVHSFVTKNSILADKLRPEENDEKNYSSRLEPALLSAIVTVDPDKCFVTPCGHWKGSTKVSEKFEDLKLSIQGRRPSYGFLSKDFDCILDNSKLLMNEIMTPDTCSTGFLGTSTKGDATISFQHIVFEVYFFYLYFFFFKFLNLVM